MKSKDQKYQEAVERRIQDHMEAVASPICNEEKIPVYCDADLISAVQVLRGRLCIRKGDDQFDERIKKEFIRLG